MTAGGGVVSSWFTSAADGSGASGLRRHPGDYFVRNRSVIKSDQKNPAGFQIGTHLELFQHMPAIRCARFAGSGADPCRPGHREAPTMLHTKEGTPVRCLPPSLCRGTPATGSLSSSHAGSRLPGSTRRTRTRPERASQWQHPRMRAPAGRHRAGTGHGRPAQGHLCAAFPQVRVADHPLLPGPLLWSAGGSTCITRGLPASACSIFSRPRSSITARSSRCF